MPTNLGNLPANARFANGKVQIKRGVADGCCQLLQWTQRVGN